MKTFIKTFKQFAILFLAIVAIGCEEDDVVLPKVEANFTYTVNIDTGTVTFINISENGNTYEWSFGDGTSSTLINPVKTYENGTYTVILKAEHVSGASGTFEDEITILIPETATIPISFDGENTKYEATTFGGAAFAVVDNPDPSGANASVSKVGEITNVGATFEGFYFDLGTALDIATLKTVKVLFWSDTAVDVLLKLEEGTAADTEATASHGGTGWEEIYFTFDASGSYSRFTMFVDGPGITSGKFYIDDISQIDSADIPCLQTDLEVPIDFDCNGIDYTSKIVGNVSFEVVDNPELSGINSEESKVGKISNKGENWENAFFNLDTAIDFTTDKGISLKLFSEQALPIKLKLEDGTEDPIEVDVNHTGSGWEELTFTFTSTASYNDMVLFVDGPGTAAGTFYIDDIEQVAGTAADPCEAEAMQSLAGADFNLTFMADPSSVITEDGGALTLIDNPDFGNDVNASCKVGQIVRNPDLAFANTQIELDSKLDFNSNSGFKLKVWSPTANTNVLVKLEDKVLGNTGPVKEVPATTSAAMAWQELTFDFSADDSGKFDRIVLFFELGQNVAATYYIDDFALYGSGSGSTGGGSSDANVILDFENNLAGVSAGEFETGGALIANPVSGGINTSPNVYEASYNSGNQWWGGIGFVFADGLDQQTTVYKAKFYSTTAPTNVLFQVEVDGTNAPVGEVQQITTANEWVELTFTLSNIPSGVNRILIRPDVGNQDGTKPNTGSLYIDDIAKVTDGGGSTGGGGTGGSGGGGADGELTTNGDFETGDITGWTTFATENNGTFAASNSEAQGGTFSGLLVADVAAAGGSPSFPLVKQANIGIGTVTPNTSVTISFWLKGTIEGAGGVVFPEFFSELATEGVSKAEILGGGPIFPTGDWVFYEFTTTTGSDVGGGVTLQLKADCGGNADCKINAFFDNVSVKMN